MRSRALVSVLVAAGLAAALSTACGTDAVGIEACRTIEAARCRRAPGCGIDLSRPVRERGDDVESCERFYKDACLHGLASKNDPGGPGVQACVAAIDNDPTCAVVKNPEIDPACAFLIPAPPTPDAAAPAPAPVDAGPG